MYVHNKPWQAAEMDCTEVKDFEIGPAAVNNLFQDSVPVGRAAEIGEGAQAEWSMSKLNTSKAPRTH